MNDVNFIKFCVCMIISFAVSFLIALMSDLFYGRKNETEN